MAKNQTAATSKNQPAAKSAGRGTKAAAAPAPAASTTTKRSSRTKG